MLGVTVPSLKGAMGARYPSLDTPLPDLWCLQPPAHLGGPGRRQGGGSPSPHTPSLSWRRGPSLFHLQFLLFVPFPQGLWLGGFLVLLPF